MPRKRKIEPAPASTPDGRSKSEADAIIQASPAPARIERALELLTPRNGLPGLCYSDVQTTLMKEFGISASTAAEALRRAYEVIKTRLQAADLPSVIRTEMEALARDAHAKGERNVASVTWFRLGRLSGLTDESEESQARKLTDAALAAAIAAEVAVRLERMSAEEVEELVKRKRDGGGS